MTDGIAQGKTFRHAKFIDEDGKPELCRVTRVNRPLDRVDYRVGIEVGEDMKFHASLEYFRSTALLGWAVTEQGRFVVQQRLTGPGATYEYSVTDAFAKAKRTDLGAMGASCVWMQSWDEAVELAKRAESPHAGFDTGLCGVFELHTREGVIAPDNQPTLYVICGCGRGYAWGHYVDSARLTRWLVDHDADVACTHARPKQQIKRDGGTYCADCGVTR